MSTTFECPKCGAQQPDLLANGSRLYNCPACGQAIHPLNCVCFDCDLRQMTAEAELGIHLLAKMKQVRAQDEHERARLGLPPEPKHGGDVGLVITGNFVTKCHHCGRFPLTDFFCPDCGHRVDGQPCPRC